MLAIGGTLTRFSHNDLMTLNSNARNERSRRIIAGIAFGISFASRLKGRETYKLDR